MTRAQAVEAALVEARKRLLLTGRDRDTLDMIDRALALAQVAGEAVAWAMKCGDDYVAVRIDKDNLLYEYAPCPKCVVLPLVAKEPAAIRASDAIGGR